MAFPLVLIPGLMCDAALWLPQRWAIAPQRQVMVADHTSGTSINQIARMVLSAAPERFALAGLSMGGYVALEICRLAPERVDRLALLDTNAHDDPDESQQRRSNMVARAAAGEFESIIEELLPLLVHPDHLARADIVHTHRSMAKRAGVDAFMRQQKAVMHRRDQRDVLPFLKMPALVLCGAEDALSPVAKHEEMANLLPNAKLDIIPHCGHLATLEQPEHVTAKMQAWLE